MNAVETLFSAFPAFMYIDPRIGGLLLEPLFRLQASPSYKIPYPVTDLGASPNRRLEALIIEDLKGQNTPMSRSATPITMKGLNVRISLEVLANYHY